jgi:hypothetical protein
LSRKRGNPDAFPFRAMMGAAIAHLHWTPDAFWRATNHEFQSAQDAIAAANSVNAGD